MTQTEPVAHARHARWTTIPGTVFEVYQAGGTDTGVYLLDNTCPTGITFDVDGPVRVRLNHTGIRTTHYGVRMHPNPANDDETAPRVGASVSPTVGEHQARESARGMNAIASGPDGGRYWVLLAEVVTRDRILLADGGEVLTPWTTVEESAPEDEGGAAHV